MTIAAVRQFTRAASGTVMIDLEIERLRRLRGSALRVRAVSRALGGSRWTPQDPLLDAGACAAWRVARAVTGYLRAHPYAPYQKGATLGVLVKNSVAAKAAILASSTRTQALEAFEGHLKALTRELDDARALTRASDLSDTLGRCQNECRILVQALGQQLHGAFAPGVTAQMPLNTLPRAASAATSVAPRHATVAIAAGPRHRDWPYLAI